MWGPCYEPDLPGSTREELVCPDLVHPHPPVSQFALPPLPPHLPGSIRENEGNLNHTCGEDEHSAAIRQVAALVCEQEKETKNRQAFQCRPSECSGVGKN